MTLSDDQILARAAQITRARLEARQQQDQVKLKRLYKAYGRKPTRLEHRLGRPKKLSMVEAVLVAALDRTRYLVTAECPNNNRWHGDAECAYHTRDRVIVMMMPSRLELLWELWGSVSDQPKEHVTPTEARLQGSSYHQHLKQLSKELTDVRNL